MICEDEVLGTLLCVQDFVRSPHFTQRNFFSESGVATLAESAAICDSITSSAVFEPWSHVETASRSQVVAEVCSCVNHAVDRRRVVKDSQEKWYAVGGIRPTSEDSASRSSVRISNNVGEGQVEYVPVSVPSLSAPGSSNLRVSSGSPRRGRLVEALWKDASRLQVSPYHLNNFAWLRNWVLVPLWNASNPAKNHGTVGETEEPLLYSRVDCHSCCYFVSKFENCSVSS